MKKTKLIQVRKEMGYTQKEVSQAIPTDASNYSRKESDDVKIIPEEWGKDYSFLKVPPEEIYESDLVSSAVTFSSFSGAFFISNHSLGLFLA